MSIRRPTQLAVVATALLAVAVPPAIAYQRPGAVDRVTIALDGGAPDADSTAPATSADGRYVAFHSFASDLVPGDVNGRWDVFVRDQETGEIELISVGLSGQRGDRDSSHPTISPDGRYVAFNSQATNFFPGDSNNVADVFLRDRLAGTTERISVATDGGTANGFAAFPVVSPDGRFVTFESFASNLVPEDTNGYTDIFLRDRQRATTERISLGPGGEQVAGSNLGPAPISADGRFIAFASTSPGLVRWDYNLFFDVFVHDRLARTTERVSVAWDGGEANFDSFSPALSADGRYVAFTSRAFNLVPFDHNRKADVFVYDRATRRTERVSVASDGTESNSVALVYHLTEGAPSISADGRYVAFDNVSTNLVPGDTNGFRDAFVYDRATGATERVSVPAEGMQADGESVFPSIDPTGRFVAFESWAYNLDPDIDDDMHDVFVRDRGPANGIGHLHASPTPAGISVSGWAGLSGGVVASVADPPNDGGALAPAAARAGAEIVGAELVHRPETHDLMLRVDLASLPAPAAGLPGIVYRWGFRAGGVRHEVRALRAGASAVPPGAPYAGLYRCDPTPCTEIARLAGTLGTTGIDLRVVLPLAAIGASTGTTLTAQTVAAGIGEAASAATFVVDDAPLPDATVAPPRVELGVAPEEAPEAAVAFTTPALLTDGRFSGTIDAGGLPSGGLRVWARACLATCGPATAVRVHPS